MFKDGAVNRPREHEKLLSLSALEPREQEIKWGGSQVTKRGPGGRGFGGPHGGTRRVVVPVPRRLVLEDSRHEETEAVLGWDQGEGLDLGRADRK